MAVVHVCLEVVVLDLGCSCSMPSRPLLFLLERPDMRARHSLMARLHDVHDLSWVGRLLFFVPESTTGIVLRNDRWSR